MHIQIISRGGEPEYAVLPWARYQALLSAAGLAEQTPVPKPVPAFSAAPSDQELPPFVQLRALREAKSLAIEALARAVGISPSDLGLIESGEREPAAAIRRSLARELGVQGWREPA